MASLARVLHSRYQLQRCCSARRGPSCAPSRIGPRSWLQAVARPRAWRGFATAAPWKTRIRSCERSAGGQTPLGSAKRRAARRNAAQLDETPRSSTKGAPTSLKARWGRTDGAGHSETSLRSTKRGASCPKGAWSSSKGTNPAQNRPTLLKTERALHKTSPGSTKHRQGARETARAPKTAEIQGKRRHRSPKDGAGVRIRRQRTKRGSNRGLALSWAHHGLEMRPDGALELSIAAVLGRGLGPAVESSAWTSRRCARTASTRSAVRGQDDEVSPPARGRGWPPVTPPASGRGTERSSREHSRDRDRSISPAGSEPRAGAAGGARS